MMEEGDERGAVTHPLLLLCALCVLRCMGLTLRGTEGAEGVRRCSFVG